ncbi:MAG: AfsR/SARP family transcriptional regulator, partial [Ktedonobacteraceae bacterium]
MKMKPTDTAQSTCPSNDLHFRIYTFGSFHIDWVDPSTGQILPLPPERLQGQNAGSALGLLKALLGCPDRFATRSWLQEQFWPTSRQQSATERLHDVTSALRGLLRPAGSKAMLVHYIYGTDGQGAGYQLDALPRIWCDAHAFEWYVKHGMLLDQRGQDSTACWERAFQLMERGMYLPEYLYDDWASKRREVLSGLMRDCVQRWTLLLRQAGHVDEAIMRMRSYWLAHRTDEDALRPLLEMLGERERFQEAEECYAKAQAEVEEDGHKLHERTQETLEVVRALQIQRIPSFKSPVAIVRLSTSTLSCSSLPSEDIIPERVISQPLPLESSALTNVFDRATQFMVTIFGLANRWQGRAAHCNDLQVLLSQEFAMFEQDASQPNAGEQHALSRRQALVAIAALPYGALAAARHAGVGLQPEEFLPQSTAAITSCWSIMQNREFTVVE